MNPTLQAFVDLARLTNPAPTTYAPQHNPVPDWSQSHVVQQPNIAAPPPAQQQRPNFRRSPRAPHNQRNADSRRDLIRIRSQLERQVSYLQNNNMEKAEEIQRLRAENASLKEKLAEFQREDLELGADLDRLAIQDPVLPANQNPARGEDMATN